MVKKLTFYHTDTKKLFSMNIVVAVGPKTVRGFYTKT